MKSNVLKTHSMIITYISHTQIEIQSVKISNDLLELYYKMLIAGNFSRWLCLYEPYKTWPVPWRPTF